MSQTFAFLLAIAVPASLMWLATNPQAAPRPIEVRVRRHRGNTGKDV
ncbi:hypothetical protein [Bradyrhizobium sp. WD16]|nr:hypothetical protein [Bradyrhizobium sp. WD16]